MRWDLLGYNFIGYYPKTKGSSDILFKYGDSSEAFATVQRKLAQIGYPITITKKFDADT